MAAKRAFSAPSPLPLNEDTLAHAKAIEGRERLTGAFLIELDRIRPDPAQPRKALDTKTLYELSASIDRLGILQPISVRYLADGDFYQIISGERRYQAAKSLGLPAIPCWVRTPKAEQVLIHQVVENWQRADLHPYDLADALVVLRDSLGFSQKQIADLTGKPESEISRLLSLLKLNPAAQREARQDESGILTRRHLVAVAHLPEGEQHEFLQDVKQQGLTAVQTEHVVSARQKARSTGGPKRGAPVTRRRFATSKATVVMTFRKGEVMAKDILAVLDEIREQLDHADGLES